MWGLNGEDPSMSKPAQAEQWGRGDASWDLRKHRDRHVILRWDVLRDRIEAIAAVGRNSTR